MSVYVSVVDETANGSFSACSIFEALTIVVDDQDAAALDEPGRPDRDKSTPS